MRIDFDWDPAKAASNAAKHGVTFEGAMTLFRDPLALSRPDDDHSTNEERWITLGLASTGNLLLVVHTWADIGLDHSAVRIISARRPSRNEARQYREDIMP
ncbi:MAG: BrnT family toxin [Beijerinckiaceae bacterium]